MSGGLCCTLESRDLGAGHRYVERRMKGGRNENRWGFVWGTLGADGEGRNER